MYKEDEAILQMAAGTRPKVEATSVVMDVVWVNLSTHYKLIKLDYRKGNDIENYVKTVWYTIGPFLEM